MSGRVLVVVFLSVVVIAGCAGGGQLQPEPVQRRGRIERSSNFVEAVGRNRIRVVAFDFGGVKMGQCATPEGDLIDGVCAQTRAIPNAVPDTLDVTQGAPEIDTLEITRGGVKYSSAQLKQRPLSDYNSGMFRQYSLRTDTTGSAAVAVAAGAKSDSKIFISRHLLVFEWRRYTLDETAGPGAASRSPYVSGIERGIAVRVVFDVSLRSVDVNASLTFGFGSLATALASSRASVEVGYELIGTTMDILPERATNITSVDGYIEAMNRFYDAVRRISLAWECIDFSKASAVSTRGECTVVPASTNTPAKYTQAGQDASSFVPGILAYYVSGVRSDRVEDAASYAYGYQLGIEGTRKGQPCDKILSAAQLSSGESGLRQGVEQALMDLRGGGSWCQEKSKAAPPDARAQALARTLPFPPATPPLAAPPPVAGR